jgi:hypothetical protein
MHAWLELQMYTFRNNKPKSELNDSNNNNYYYNNIIYEERGSVVVKALRYKPEGRGFDTRWGEFLNLPNPSGRTKPWGLLSL